MAFAVEGFRASGLGRLGRREVLQEHDAGTARSSYCKAEASGMELSPRIPLRDEGIDKGSDKEEVSRRDFVFKARGFKDPELKVGDVGVWDFGIWACWDQALRH